MMNNKLNNDLIIIGCSHGIHLADKIAQKLKISCSKLEVNHFPDSEIYLRFKSNIKGKIVVLIQSFYENINDCVVEALFAAQTAKELGAKKIILAAPYFPYLRQDIKFKAGECNSLKTIAKYIDENFDELCIIDPHLHREKTLKHIFKIKSTRLTANPLITSYIKKNIKKIKNPLIIGPDEESYKWAEAIANASGCDSAILRKKRYSASRVKVMLNKKINLKNKNIVIVDDIISTGNTIIETAKLLKRLGADKFTVICVHGIFTNNALERLKKNKINVTACNTLPNKVAKIDVSPLLIDWLAEIYRGKTY